MGWNKDLEELDYWYESVYHPKIAVTRSGADTVTIQEGNGTRSYNMDCKIIRSPPSREFIRRAEEGIEGYKMDSRAMKAVNEAVALQLYNTQKKIEREIERQMGHQVPSLEDMKEESRRRANLREERTKYTKAGLEAIREDMRRQGVDPDRCTGVRTKSGLITVKEFIKMRQEEMETPWVRLG
jgi:hypothetical protein